MKITPGTYSSTKIVTALPSGHTTGVYFDPYTTTGTGSFTITVYTDLYVDQFREDDTIRRELTVSAHDVGPSVINSPPLEIWHQSTSTPQANVTNYGSVPETFNVTMKITPGTYSSTKTVTALPSGFSSAVVFAPYTTTGTGQFTITVYTELYGDQNISNDTLRRGLTVATHDVGVASLRAPESEVWHPSIQIPQANIKNYGSATETFNVTMKITPGSYSSTKTVTALPPGVETIVQFDPYTTTGTGSFTITVYTELYIDQNRSNDTLRAGLTVAVRDVGTLSIDAPIGTALEPIKPCQTFKPKGTFKNFGTAPQTFNVMCRITDANGFVWTNYKLVTALAPLATKQITFDDFSPPKSGNYNIKDSTCLEGDLNISNNAKTSVFVVRKPTEVKFKIEAFKNGTTGNEKLTVKACGQEKSAIFVEGRTTNQMIGDIIAQINGQNGFTVKLDQIGFLTISHTKGDVDHELQGIVITKSKRRSAFEDANVYITSNYHLLVSGTANGGGTVSFNCGDMHISTNTIFGQTSLDVVNALTDVLDSISPNEDTTYSYGTMYNVDSSGGPAIDPVVLAIWQLGNRNLDNATFESTDPGIDLSTGESLTSGDAYYSDSFDGANDVISLQNRGYKVYRNGTGQPNPASQIWYDGDSSIFHAYDGPANGYVQSNYQCIVGAGNIDNWLVLPPNEVEAGDVTSFFAKARGNSGLKDSLRVMYSATGDSVPGAAGWIELGRFKVNISAWEQKKFPVTSSGVKARFAIRYTVANGGPQGNASDYAGIDALTIERVLYPEISLQLKMYNEGFYNPASNSIVSDTARVYLRNASTSYNIIDSSKGVINSSGAGTFLFSNAVNGTNYYIVVKHRNSIETWSAVGNSFINSTLLYDFSDAQSQAFGNNMKQIDNAPLRFGLFSGDVNQDGSVDVTDIIGIYNDANSFSTGYVKTDVTGDAFVDASDLIITFNNSNNFVAIIRP